MFRFSWFAVQVILVIIGIAWCIAIIGRRHEDMEVLRTSKDAVERGVVIAYWLMTAVVVLLLAIYGTLVTWEFFTLIRDVVQ